MYQDARFPNSHRTSFGDEMLRTSFGAKEHVPGGEEADPRDKEGPLWNLLEEGLAAKNIASDWALFVNEFAVNLAEAGSRVQSMPNSALCLCPRSEPEGNGFRTEILSFGATVHRGDRAVRERHITY